MKKTLILPLILLVQFCFAQGWVSSYNDYWDFYLDGWNHGVYSISEHGDPMYYRPEDPVEKIHYSIIDKKGKEKQYVKEFNEKGRLTNYYKIEDNGQKMPLQKYEYLTKLHAKMYVFDKKGEIDVWIERKFHAKNQPSFLLRYGTKNKLYSKKTWNYNEEDCLIASHWYKKKDRLKRRWEYDNYGDCKRSETRLFNGKDKLLKTWNYQCKEEGEQLQKKKKTTQYCNWDETTKDYLLKITQSFDEKGRLWKYVTKYDIKDTTIIERKTYNGKDELTFMATYDHAYQLPLAYTSYKKGKERTKRIYQYEEEHLIAETYYKKGEEWSKKVQRYEDEKMVFASYAKKGNTRSKWEYTYEDELLREYRYFGRGERLKQTIKLSY